MTTMDNNENRFVFRRCRNQLTEPLIAPEETREGTVISRDDERDQQSAPRSFTRRAQNQTLAEPLLASEEPQECVVSRGDDGEDQPAQTKPQSRNINLILAFTLFAFAGRSLWSQSVLSTLVYLLRNDNPEAVGFITAVMGMSQLIASFPTGILADRHRRDSLLKVASVVGIVAVAVTLFSVWRESYQWLTVALAVWGTFWGIASTSLSALFADSIQEGDRSFYFTRRSIILKVGNMAGPVAALILFAVLGDKWTIRDCSIVMGVGQILCLPAMFILCFLNDDNAVQHDELSEAFEPSTQSSTGSDNSDLDFDDTTLDSGASDSSPSKYCCCCLPEHRFIPVLIALADVLSGLGSGMSIRYFPIFFLDNLKLSPVIVQVLYTISPLGQAVLMHVGQVWSRSVGRCKMTVVFKWTGVTCMLVMVASYVCHLPTWSICLFFLLRTSFMNATSALTKSVLMDAVPKNERGKWSALESVNMFSWSGSAALGGLLVGYKGIIFNFLVTGSIQFLATFPLVLLFSREGTEGATQVLASNPRDEEAPCGSATAVVSERQACDTLAIKTT